ncbi:MAG: cytochrome c [Gammaproteobacteria bacterium]
MTRSIAFVILAAGLLSAGVAQASGNAALGKTKSAPCAACHGADGKGTAPNFPVLAGQHASYLAHSLKEYRSGARKNAVMAPQAAGLSDADIADLAAYYASLEGLETPSR